MLIQTLASGSSGNCALLRGRESYILIDAGISLRRIKSCLKKYDIGMENISAIVLTHEHSDHVCALPMIEKYTDIPVITSGGTARKIIGMGKAEGKNFKIINGEESFSINEIEVNAFETPHDAAQSMCFSFSCEGSKIAAVTDLGHVTPSVQKAALGADVVMLESNHDIDMLRSGPYPYRLQMRILGQSGHLSNDAAGDFAVKLVESGTRQIVLAHLSRQNNTPRLAYSTVADKLLRAGVAPGTIKLAVAPADEAGCAVEV